VSDKRWLVGIARVGTALVGIVHCSPADHDGEGWTVIVVDNKHCTEAILLDPDPGDLQNGDFFIYTYLVKFSLRSTQLFQRYEPNCGKMPILQCRRILQKIPRSTACLKKKSPTFLAVTRESIVGFS